MKREHFMLGATDEAYGCGVWVGRIEGLKSHLRIIADHLPDDASWLRNQVRSAIAEADRYLADYSPLCDSDGSGEAGETAKQGSTEGDSAAPSGDRP